ncbi:MAG: metal ABC transporter ATP-binding protein [Candidatus Moraniibacteriota bacterium]
MSELKHPIIEAERIFFHYGKEEVLHDISFAVEQGDYIGLVGSNGSGKTTLLKILLGLTAPTAGTAKLFGIPVNRFRDWQNIGYVPQHVFRGDMDFPATVEEVVESGHSGTRCRSGGSACGEAKRALERAGIAHLLKKRIGELSGGERQRVFIARALVAEPALLILDEPTTGIDAATEKQFYAFLDELNRSGMTIILVSHDLEAIAREVKTVLCLNRRLVCYGTPEHLRSAEVLEEMYGRGKQMLHHEHEHHHRTI